MNKTHCLTGNAAIRVREAKQLDFARLEEILLQNGMLTSPEIDGKEAMHKIRELAGRYFLVAELDNLVVGMVRACYDGSRALVHQMAVDKRYQKQGIGKMLIYNLASRLRSDGAKSISVTATEKSKSYYAHLSFSDLPITLMVCFDINDVIKKTKPGGAA